MGYVSKTGWLVKNAIDHGRGFHVVAPDGDERNGRIFTPQEVKSEIEKRMNMIAREEPLPNEELEPGERVWIFKQKMPNGSIDPVSLRFIGPDRQRIRQIRRENVERRMELAAIRRERRELARQSTISSSRNRDANSRNSGSTSRRL